MVNVQLQTMNQILRLIPYNSVLCLVEGEPHRNLCPDFEQFWDAVHRVART